MILNISISFVPAQHDKRSVSLSCPKPVSGGRNDHRVDPTGGCLMQGGEMVQGAGVTATR